MIGIVCYKFHYTLDYALSLTIPQIYFLNNMLGKILELENGTNKPDNSSNIPTNDTGTNTFVMGETLKYMKKMCNKDSFTLAEMVDPSATIKKYQNLNA